MLKHSSTKIFRLIKVCPPLFQKSWVRYCLYRYQLCSPLVWLVVQPLCCYTCFMLFQRSSCSPHDLAYYCDLQCLPFYCHCSTLRSPVWSECLGSFVESLVRGSDHFFSFSMQFLGLVCSLGCQCTCYCFLTFSYL